MKNKITMSVYSHIVYAHRRGQLLKTFATVELAEKWVYDNGYVVEWDR